MKTIKTIIETKHLEKVLNLLDELDLLISTTEIHDKQEKNTFKKLFKDKFTLLITTCAETQKSTLVKKIFPVITMVGGICLA